MAFARLALHTLLILLGLFVLVGLLLPAAVTVERSIFIQASPERVFAQLDDLSAFHDWSPWNTGDPQTAYRFAGPARGVGARMLWSSGDAQAGAGSLEIVHSEPYRRVDTELVFGDQGGGHARFDLEPEAGGTRVRWQFHTRFGWDLFGRYVGLMLDNMIGSQYQRGLATLKARLETSAQPDASASG